MTTSTALPATHTAFGVTWHLPMDFPPFAPVEGFHPADVVVVEEPVPRPSPQADWAGPLRAVENGSVTFGVPGAGRMRITGGNRIGFERHDDWTEESIRLMLMGPGAALVLHQRGVLPLHGSGVVTDHGAVLVVGHSGAGKSSTLGAFVDRGFTVLCDDLAAVTLEDDGTALVHPGTQVVKLWADSAASLGWDTEGLERVRPELEKFMVPLRHRGDAPVPLAAVYQVTAHNQPTLEMMVRERAAKFNVLLDHTWQKMTVKRMGLHGSHFTRATTIADSIRVVTIRRPEGVSVAENGLLDAILTDLKQTEARP